LRATLQLRNHNAAMAPSTTIAPHKANNHERFLSSNAKDAIFPPEFDLDPSDTEAGALQPVNAPEDDWEGFDNEDEADAVEEDGEKEDDEAEDDNDDASMDIAIEKKKKEKVVLPKDAEEEELEKLVFGDSAGFKQGIDSFSLDNTAYGEISDDEQEGDEDLEDAADQDLFFFDSGPTAAPAGSLAVAKVDESDDDDKPAWEDSDDERLIVSLATVPQLRKLRETAEDDLVNGKEYVRRLRNQYERLYSTPDWAIQATGKAKRKRQHTMEDGESDVESGSDMDVDGDDLSTQPLARLLKDADILSRASRAPAKRRKLQAGTVDIQRLKDVNKAGPVCIPVTRCISMLIGCIVCNNLSLFPSYLPTTPLVRSQLYAIFASRQPKPAYSEPSPYLSAHQAHAAHHNCVPPVRFRLSSFH
jgi:U3 small nucleolar RNA-associated protein 18